MADNAAVKHTVELTVPVEQVDEASARVIAGLKKKVKLPGFRPGKAPDTILRSRFESEIRQDVLETVIPKAFNEYAEREHLKVVGKPDVTDVHFHKGEPLKFTISFETFPEFELGEYRGLTVPYNEPSVDAADVDSRLEQVRERKAEYVNVDPRPVEDGDHAAVSLRSVAGVEPPVVQDEIVLHVGAEDTLEAFTANLRGMSPGEEKEFDVSYPEDYGGANLAGKTVRFQVLLKGIRKKELPELNDEFASDVGDFKTLEELRDHLRLELLREREFSATQEAKSKLMDQLVAAHDFPVPDAFVDRQVQAELEGRIRDLMARGIDPAKLNLDWREVAKARREPATRDVKASLLIDRIAEREAIETLTDEVDREVHRIARQVREPAAAVRKKLQDDGSLAQIATRIRTDKVLNFLFENARKVAPEAEPPAESA